MATEGIPLGIARAVLHGETDALRFERFCVDFVSSIEGGTLVVTTSRSWDRGRDGRSVGPGPRIFVCASITTGVPAKVTSDLAKIAKSKVRVDKIYFCTTQEPSESTLDSITAAFSSAEVCGMSASQIAQLCGGFPEPMRKHYPAEIRELLDALAADQTAQENEREALLLALATASHPNSSSVRDAAYDLIIRRVLRTQGACTMNELGKAIGDRLRLAAPLQPGALRPHLDKLIHDERIKIDGGRYVLTDKGAAAIDDDSEVAGRTLLEGRLKIRQAIEDSLGTRLPDPQFDRVWKVIKSKLANFFYAQGFRMVHEISLLSGTQAVGEVAETKVPFFVDELAKSVRDTSTSPEQQKEIERAIRYIFSERRGPAYEWIGSVCASFVLACMLGLEAHSGHRLRVAIGSTHLILDTDVILDLLGEGEPENQPAAQLVTEWRKLGGSLHLASPVAEEVAYHAWIAPGDYAESRAFLRTESDRRNFVRNVFVRSFGYLVESRRLGSSSWQSYIANFKGRTSDDTSVVVEMLHEDYGFMALADDDLKSEPGESVWESLRAKIDAEMLPAHERKIKLDKARRDARLFGSMVHFAERLRAGGRPGACILVTSARRLHGVGAQYGGTSDRTLSLGAALYLLTVVPGVSLGLTALHSVLFDQELLPRTQELEMLVMRSVRESGYDMPAARRQTLYRRVREGLLKVARDHEKEFLRPENISHTLATSDETQTGIARVALSEVIGKALQGLGASSPQEQELERLRAENAKLKAQLQAPASQRPGKRAKK